MPSELHSTILSNPLSELNAAFDAACAKGDEAALKHGAVLSLASKVEAVLERDGASAVPSLNVLRQEELPAGALVRFQGMVMDMHDPEYYAGVYEEVRPDGASRMRTGKFRDTFDEPAGCTIRPRSDFTWQRTPIVCAPCEPEAAPDPHAAWSRSAALGTSLVKLYDGAEEGAGEASLRLNDVVEFYGVLELGGETDVADGDESAISMLVDEQKALRPPPSAQPRLHCLYYRKIAGGAAHPLLPAPDTYAETLAYQLARHHVADARAAVTAQLAAALGGDGVAAELTLWSVLSRVITRRGEAPIGKLPLNITGCPSAVAQPAASPVGAALQGALSALLPCVVPFRLTIETLNATPMVPRKDYSANILSPGALQLPAGAALLIDETGLAPGKLSEAGLKSLGALKDLIARQKLAFDFTYFAHDVDADVSLLSLSSLKSVLAKDSPGLLQVALAVQPDAPQPPPLDAASLEAARTYLGLAVRCLSSLKPTDEKLAAALQDDFVAARRADATVSPDDFSHWLTCARLHAASCLATEVSIEHYMHAKQVEAARVARLRQVEV
ncbi:hypothetical protein EMIHUDRAFT_202875 [Emiliania huxleyi CCMP1516]|uniref:Mini-chromosome maintenance complex-binding protein n=2 Tax=Emiliania huxleyi TaxID=2903 RepID=A0A0D3K8Z1_EMIH1|nr:hypothetical protein EMIHUDRAFT_202875 [Emiliania huxleyi CCMP1516]EOD32226.1 hypothetical protein EMIHUDRAFT_202875 [Emiliania huxleyi CCMP1516]|eukprot:XP_005784655.1 hypothetical protein EMIHUDRAFT_202875 [Emiliania huxleyi CCMP1516]